MNSDEDPGSRTGPDRTRSIAALGESGIVSMARLAAGRPDPFLIRGIGDDAAVLAGDGKTVVTTDLLIEDVHFKLDRTPPRLLGRKSVAVNVSDLSAMGCDPRFIFLAAGLPPSYPQRDLELFLEGVMERALDLGVSLAGGDTCRSEKMVISITAMGSAAKSSPVYRSGARPGDGLFVTGTVGDSALGFIRLMEIPAPVTEDMVGTDKLGGPLLRHLDPPARVEEGKALAGPATSMIDVSDGLFHDVARIAEESRRVGVNVYADSLPLSDAFKEYFHVRDRLGEKALAAALTGGEDYELLFTAPLSAEKAVAKISSSLGTRITRIGEITGGEGVRILNGKGEEIEPPRPIFMHFEPEAGGASK